MTEYYREFIVGDPQRADHNSDWQGVKILEREKARIGSRGELIYERSHLNQDQY